MKNRFSTKKASIKTLKDLKFVIPSYQRPYVWGDEQIKKLLMDFNDAYKLDEGKYYIGSVLTSNNTGDNELIDGQQRFITVWLIAVSFRILKIGSELELFLKAQDDLRIDFTIRKQLKSYFLSLLDKGKNDKNVYSDKEVEADEYLINVAKAVSSITQTLETLKYDLPKNLRGFGDYIYRNILFIQNTTPPNTNLNKLFATINNSGLQLEQTDILKSLLLKHIKTDRLVYSRIWEACENMHNYFERNVRSLFKEIEWTAISFDELGFFDKEKFLINANASLYDITNYSHEAYSISDIINNKIEVKTDEKNPEINYFNEDGETDEVIYCRSIISFNQLLIHTYRIYLKEEGKPDFELPFHPKNLLKIFENLHKDDYNEREIKIKKFIECLWKVRFAFDKYVVKWIQNTEDKDSNLMLTSAFKDNKGYISRIPEVKSASAMLQSVLYFTGNYNTQIWLTPFLKRQLDKSTDKHYTLSNLEKIDNILSLSLDDDKTTSYLLMDKSYFPENIIDLKSYLAKNEGVSFQHYWFQKLEYILWKEFDNIEQIKNEHEFKNYRITSKNSIEHVFPQHHEFGEKLTDSDLLDCFGNLALLNVSQNSSYSNQDVAKKQIDFFKKPVYDSLKLYLLYEKHMIIKDSEFVIKEHRDEMIKKILNHYTHGNQN